MPHASHAAPHFTLFRREQCEAVHHASLEILRRTGVRVDHAGALALLRQTDAVITDGNLVRFPPALVEWALAGPPSRIALCRRGSSEVAIRMEGREVSFGTGSACPNYPRSDDRRAPALHRSRRDRVRPAGGRAAGDRFLHVHGHVVRPQPARALLRRIRADARKHHQAARVHPRQPAGVRGDRGDGGRGRRRASTSCGSTRTCSATANPPRRCSTARTRPIS